MHEGVASHNNYNILKDAFKPLSMHILDEKALIEYNTVFLPIRAPSLTVAPEKPLNHENIMNIC